MSHCQTTREGTLVIPLILSTLFEAFSELLIFSHNRFIHCALYFQGKGMWKIRCTLVHSWSCSKAITGMLSPPVLSHKWKPISNHTHRPVPNLPASISAEEEPLETTQINPSWPVSWVPCKTHSVAFLVCGIYCDICSLYDPPFFQQEFSWIIPKYSWTAALSKHPPLFLPETCSLQLVLAKLASWLKFVFLPIHPSLLCWCFCSLGVITLFCA